MRLDRLLNVTKDRRTQDLRSRGQRLEQFFADEHVEREWRKKVSENEANRRARNKAKRSKAKQRGKS